MKLLLGLLLLIAAYSVSANDEREKPRKPPKEAIEACENRQLNDNVTFIGRHGERIEATCQKRHDQLIAVPQSHRKDSKPNQESSRK